MIACIDISWMLSPKDYFYAIISAVIGTLLGIWWARRQFQKQKDEEARQVLSDIVDSLNFNKERSVQAIGQLNSHTIPNYPLDGSRLSSLIQMASGRLPSELIRRLDWHRFQLDHITSKLTVINGFVLSASVPSPHTQPAYQQMIAMLRQSLVDHYQTVIDATDDLVGETKNYVSPQ